MLTIIGQSLQRILNPFRKRLDHGTRLSSAKLDCLAAVSLCLDLLSTAPTLSRQIACNIAISVATMKNLMNQSEIDEIRLQCTKLDMVSNWQYYLHRVTDCSFFYWSLELVPIVLADIFDHSDQVFVFILLLFHSKFIFILLGTQITNHIFNIK